MDMQYFAVLVAFFFFYDLVHILETKQCPTMLAQHSRLCRASTVQHGLLAFILTI